jgi:hypothetical protein
MLLAKAIAVKQATENTAVKARLEYRIRLKLISHSNRPFTFGVYGGCPPDR